MKSILTIVLVLCAAAYGADPSGSWTGAIRLPTGDLGVEITLQKEAAWRGTISIPARALRDRPLANVHVT